MTQPRKLAPRFVLAVAIAGAAVGIASCSGAGRAARPAPAPAPRPAAQPAQPERKILAQAEPPPPRVQAPPASVEQPKPEPVKLEAPPPPKPAPATPEQWRPPWWIDAPGRAGGKVTVAARAEGPSLLEARKAAVNAGLAALAAVLGRQAPTPETLRYSVIRLSDGSVRGFILMSSPE